MSSALFGSPPSVSSTPSITPAQRAIQGIVGTVLSQLLGVSPQAGAAFPNTAAGGGATAGGGGGAPGGEGGGGSFTGITRDADGNIILTGGGQPAVGPATTSTPAAAGPSGTPASNIISGLPAFTSPTGGTYAAPLNPAQLGDIAAIQAQTSPGSYAGDVNAQAKTALTQILSGQPQDYSQYFKTNVAQPLEDVFSKETLPAIKAAFARSAGGTYSGSQDATGGAGNTGYNAAVTTATRHLGQTLEEAQSNLVTSAVQAAIQRQAQGLALAPQTASLPASQAATALSAETLPQNVQQQQIAGQVGQYNATIGDIIQLLGGGTSLATAPTVQPVVNPGSTGLIPGVLSGFASNQGLGSAIGSSIFGPAVAASDPRVKDSKGEESGASALDKIINLKIERAKYKGEPKGRERSMVMADNVKREFPRAVPQKTGGRQMQTVNMAELIPTMVAAIQELAKKRGAA